MITFSEYLQQKKIDPAKFKEAESHLFQDFETIFDQIHPNSFTAQKLNVINFIRRKYPLEITNEKSSLDNPEKEIKGEVMPKPAGIARPMFKRK